MTLNSLVVQLRDRFPLPKVLFVCNTILLCAFVWLAGLFGARIVDYEILEVPRQTAKFSRPQESHLDKQRRLSEFLPEIIKWNVFDAEVTAKQVVVEVEPEQTAVPGAALKKILSDLLLKGVALRSARSIHCFIQNKKTKREDIFSIGDEVFETGAIVKRIYTTTGNERVLLQLGGETGILKYEEAKKDKKTSRKRTAKPRRRKPIPTLSSSYTSDGKNFHIESSEVENHLKNLPKLLNQARMVPYFRNGKSQGFQVKAIDKGSLYEKLGLRNLDIIKAVNGESLAGAGTQNIMNLFDLLKNEREFTIEIERAGSSETFNYYKD